MLLSEMNHKCGRYRDHINDKEDKKYVKLIYHKIKIVEEFR